MRCSARSYQLGVLLLTASWFATFSPDAYFAAGDDLATAAPVASDSPLVVVVMDPLSLPLSCACVNGVGQRQYQTLADKIAVQTGREVKLVYEESLQLAMRRDLPQIDVVIGKRSTVLSDASHVKLSLRAMAGLTDHNGSTELRGVVLVAKSDPAQKLRDLTGKKVAIGSPEHDECNRLAKQLFSKERVPVEFVECDSIESAVYAFSDKEVDAVVVSEYLPPLLEGCGKIGKGESRGIATTEASAGVQVFVATDVDSATRSAITQALAAIVDAPQIKQDIESRDGFVLIESATGWLDWRGPRRAGQFPGLPKSLGEQPDVIWTASLTGPAMAGITASLNHVIVADKSSAFDEDVFRVFDASTGTALWTITQSAAGRMEYTNSPRATPVIADDVVLFQSAFGRLTCAHVDTGKVLWQRHFIDDFEGKLPPWGYCLPPLVVGERIIIAPGGESSSVIALQLRTGEPLWRTAGHAAAYAPFIYGTFGGRDQVVGYDAASLGGWDLETGTRLWELVPPDNTDFHVSTPVELDGGILLATENNGTRLYQFNRDGTIENSPTAENLDCGPDTCTPVVVTSNGTQRVFCCAYGELFCLDATSKLETLWSERDDRFYDHTCLIAGNDRVLLWSSDCDLLLLDASQDQMQIVSAWRPMSGDHPEGMSHPAIVGDRLYLRSQTELRCIRLPTDNAHQQLK